MKLHDKTLITQVLCERNVAIGGESIGPLSHRPQRLRSRVLSGLPERIFEVHLARAALLCANITIMALDNERDAGSIVVLAATPVQLICVAIHIFLALTTN
ncbi:unnamed protein product [Heligmosomoides polygyrus]|uniref:Uncharacterized protein n=1 Tax=Heligmosomoides polygyrus TaxID=6339 RepID=A0A3P8BK87_HELPZ|nr:unnamed protein product [Heligmosomoides polygyrus]